MSPLVNVKRRVCNCLVVSSLFMEAFLAMVRKEKGAAIFFWLSFALFDFLVPYYLFL